MQEYEFWTAITALVAMFAGFLYIVYDSFMYLDGNISIQMFVIHILAILFIEFIILEICGYYLNKKDNQNDYQKIE